MLEIIALFSVLNPCISKTSDPSAMSSCPRTACDDRTGPPAKYLSLTILGVIFRYFVVISASMPTNMLLLSPF